MKNEFNSGTYFNKSNSRWICKFSNPITNKVEYLGTFNTETEAKLKYSEKQIEFYKIHVYLLPKYITIFNSKFQLQFKYNTNNEKNKSLYLGRYNTVQEAEQAKIEFITNLL